MGNWTADRKVSNLCERIEKGASAQISKGLHFNQIGELRRAFTGIQIIDGTFTFALFPFFSPYHLRIVCSNEINGKGKQKNTLSTK